MNETLAVLLRALGRDDIVEGLARCWDPPAGRGGPQRWVGPPGPWWVEVEPEVPVVGTGWDRRRVLREFRVDLDAARSVAEDETQPPALRAAARVDVAVGPATRQHLGPSVADMR